MASAKEIPPGGEGKIDVTFDTKNRRGKQSKKVTVLSNDSKEPKLILTVSANLKEVLGVEPRALNFGTIRWDETSSQTLELIGEEVALVKLVTVVPEDPTAGKKPISEVIQGIRFKVLDRVEPSGNLPIEVSIGPDLEPGRFYGSLKITTDHPKVPELTLKVHGKIRGPVDYAPERIFLSNLEPGVDQSRSLTISGSEEHPIRVTGVRSEHAGLRFEVGEPLDHQVVIQITTDGSFTEPQVRTSMTVETSHKDYPTIEVPVSLFKKRERQEKPKPAVGSSMQDGKNPRHSTKSSITSRDVSKEGSKHLGRDPNRKK